MIQYTPQCLLSAHHHPGLIACIVFQDLEFSYSDFGIIGLETTYALLNTHLVDDSISLEELITILAINPRKLLGRKTSEIEEGAQANFTIFDPTLEWTFGEKNIGSKSKNTPFIGTAFKGKVLGVVNKDAFRRI